MSRFVDEIISSMAAAPEEFKDTGRGISRDTVQLTGYGNSRILSVVYVYIKGKAMPLSYIDSYRLEVAIGKWYRTISLKHLIK